MRGENPDMDFEISDIDGEFSDWCVAAAQPRNEIRVSICGERAPSFASEAGDPGARQVYFEVFTEAG
jgi:hypothetical protein